LIMSRIRIVFALCLSFVVGAFVPAAQAQSATAKAVIAGSSALWQSMALAAYNWKSGTTGGACIAGFTPPCSHYTNKTFQVTDTRPTFLPGGVSKTDVNTIWIVWDSHTTTAGLAPNVLAYIKVDSVVGDRCYFGHPRCEALVVGGFPAAGGSNGNQISVWPDGSTDVTPPLNVQGLFTSGSLLVSAAATDVRGEDGEFAMCRANSALPGGVVNNTMKGLGYNPNNATGACPTTNDVAHLVATVNGGDIADASGSTAHILAFNVSGTDPFSGQTIPAATTVPAGAAPIVFITHSLSSGSALDGVNGVTDSQLQSLLNSTGGGCVGTTLGGNAGNVDVWEREPLSGTYNTTEFNAFIYPDFSGTSQEAGVNPSVAGGDPLNQTCQAGGGSQIRGVGTSHVIDKGIVTDTTNDSIGYTFFGYGNVKAASDTSCSGNNCHYLTLNGIDPIFHKHFNTGGPAPVDPGQPHAFYGEVPNATDTPCGALPCREDQIWAGHLSFPNLRSGQYSVWSILRLISDGVALATVKSLALSAQTYAAINTPDFVPVSAVVASGAFPGDPGVQLLRSHYQQMDNAGALIGPAPVDDSVTGDKGGDVGGCIEHSTAGTVGYKTADAVTGLIHTLPGTECSVGPGTH
jgi:hypothetical protein